MDTQNASDGTRHQKNGEIWVEICRPTIDSPLLDRSLMGTFSAFVKKMAAPNRCGANPGTDRVGCLILNN